MGYDPAEVAQAASQAESAVLRKLRKSGGIGHTEIKQVEILPPTVCPLGDDGRYVIPTNNSGFDEYHEYYLYVDGKEFKYNHSVTVLGWEDTDPTDNRFVAEHALIRPYQIEPVPETVTAAIKQVDRIIHPIEDIYMNNVNQRVKLLENGGVLLEKAEYAFEVSGEGGELRFDNVSVIQLLTVGMSLTVHFDGVDYTCHTVNCDKMIACGNLFYLAPLDYADTGEPFILLAAPSESIVMILTIGASGNHTVGITMGDNSIDPAQLPEGSLGYTELNVLTFNGDLTGKTIVDNAFVKLSDEPIDLNEVSRVVAGIHPILAEASGMSTRIEYTAEMWTIESTGSKQTLTNSDLGVCIISVTEAEGDYSVGVWGIVQAGGTEGEVLTAYAWVSRIEYGEIIHKIDHKYLPTGGVGYTEIKVIPLLGKTTCSLWDDGYYEIPIAISSLDRNRKYNLYVDGCKFVSDFSDHGDGWVKADPADMRFNSTYWNIYPDQINPAPEMVVITIEEEIETVHTINEKFLPSGCVPILVDLSGFGSDINDSILNLMSEGGGTVTLEKVGTFWEKVDVDPNADVRLILTYKGFPMFIGGVSRGFANDRCVQVSFNSLLVDETGASYMLSVSIAHITESTLIVARVT